MKWEGDRQSDNVEDRRGEGGGGGGSGFGFGGRSIGIGTVVVALIGSWILDVNPLTMLNLLSGGGVPVQQQEQQRQQPRAQPADDRDTRFVRTVVGYTEDTWDKLFQDAGASYVKPRLVIFSGSTQTACGTGQSATGPFYCPADQRIYIDLGFFKLMRERFEVAGDFAQAYVIAHEVGHHVQNLTGASAKVDAVRRQGTEKQANAMSVRLELQADCYAGVWAYHTNAARNILEQGDVETALKAASAIGDDALQRQSQGHVVPDSFTHGTSAQRVRWFNKGLQSGAVSQCNTFETRTL